MEGKLKEIVTFLEGNFAEKKEIGRKPYVPKVEALHPATFKITLDSVNWIITRINIINWTSKDKMKMAYNTLVYKLEILHIV